MKMATSGGPLTDRNFLLDDVRDPLKNYLEKQRATLRLASFVDVASLDDESAALDAWVREKYPHLSTEAAGAVATFFSRVSPRRSFEEHDTESIESDVAMFLSLALPEIQDYYTFTTMLYDGVEQQSRVPSTPVFYSSLLTSLVSGFEVLMGDLARAILRRYPKMLDTKERNFTWAQIVEAGSLEELREMVIEDYVEGLMRSSVTELLVTYKERFHIDIPETNAPADLMEVFLRRNVWVHNEGLASKQYIKRLPKGLKKPEIGAELPIDSDYLQMAADGLISLAFYVTWTLGCKFSSKKEWQHFENYMVNFPYRLLQDERYEVVKNTSANSICTNVKNEGFKLIMQINNWLALKRLGRFNECESAVLQWQTHQLSRQFQLARLALLNENEEALELVKEIRGSDDLPLIFWQTWPLLAELRQYERSINQASAETKDIGPADAVA